MVLFLHHLYRTSGGEERTLSDLRWLVGEHLGEETELLTRDSRALGRGRAAVGLLRGGLTPEDVGAAVRRTGATVVHAHNLNPTLGWRALAAAREAGAAVVLHLHNYRLVCAVGTCFTQGEDCVRCHGRNTLPGLVHNCRGGVAESAAYAASLGSWQRRLVAQASEVVVPSRFAAERLRVLRAPLAGVRVHVLTPVLRDWREQTAAPADGPALFAGRLAAEKGVDIAIDACRLAGVPLIVAGDGPEAANLRAHAAGADVHFAGRLDDDALTDLRDRAGVAVVPSRSAETFGLSAAEAMARGLPVAGSRIGALPELLEDDCLSAPGSASGLAAVIRRCRGDVQLGARALATVRERCAPAVVAAQLQAIYASARQHHR